MFGFRAQQERMYIRSYNSAARDMRPHSIGLDSHALALYFSYRLQLASAFVAL